MITKSDTKVGRYMMQEEVFLVVKAKRSHFGKVGK